MGGGGICGAIFSKAGYDELEEECSKYETPLNDGDAVITSSCNMTNCSYIIHAVGPDFRVPSADINNLYKAYYNCLIVLKNNNLHSISFPLISSGIFGGKLDNPPYKSAEECYKAYCNFIAVNEDYDIEVLLCAFTKEEMYSADVALHTLQSNGDKVLTFIKK